MMSAVADLYAAVGRIRHDVAARAQRYAFAARTAANGEAAVLARACLAEADVVLADLDAVLTDFAPMRLGA